MTDLFYNKMGGNEGVPLFVIHTLPLDHTYIKDSLKNIEFKNPLYLIDLPSHGKSDDVEEENLNFSFMADRIEELRQSLGLEEIITVGHGIGGFVVLFYLVKYENNIHKMILVNSAGNNRYREVMAWNIRDKYSNTTKQALQQYFEKTDDKSVRVRFTQALAKYFEPANPEAAKDLMDNTHRIASEPYVYISRAILPKYAIRDLIRGKTTQTLLIVGTNDVWPNNASKLLLNDLPNSTIKEMRTGHFPMIEQSFEFWKNIQEFVID